MPLPTDNTPTFYNVKEGRIHTFANCKNLESLNVDTTSILWSHQSTREYLESEPDIKCLPFHVALKLQTESDHKRYKVGIIEETTEENFFEMLNVLPPEDWTSNQSASESFRVSEAMTGSLYSYYIRVSDGWPIKDRYFSTMADRFHTNHDKLVQMVIDQFNVQVVA